MSGITGLINPSEDISHQLNHICSVSDAIRTRGPNGSGLYVSPRSVLAQRVGCEGRQNDIPSVEKIRFLNKEYVLVLDGVIYNYLELRSELESYGCRFNGNSCAELIIYGYAVWNTACFKKMNGLFAVALWIADDSTLILARDHIGAKPLYYTLIGSTLIFASEIKGITSHPLFKATIGVEGLSELICLSPRNTPGSAVIKGIRELRPAHHLKYSPDGLSTARYWQIEEREHEDEADKTAEQIRDLIVDSVKMQMLSDCPLCGLLSGGLYSSMITAVICDHSRSLFNTIYNTWSVDYERSSRLTAQISQVESDTPWIRWICRKSGTRHHYIILSPSDLYEALPDVTEARGIPGMGDYDSALMLLFREIKKDFPIVLTGDCSDEVFGGYKPHDSYATGKRRFPWASNLAEKINVFSNEIIDMVKPHEFIEKCYEEALFDYPKFAVNTAGLGRDKESEWFSLYWNLPCLLDRLDRMSMAFNLQTRVPLCDFRLIEYLWNIPVEMKQFNGTDRGLLRKSMRDYLPAGILERKKNPFPRPTDPVYEAKIRDMLRDIIYDTGSPLRYLLDMKTLESMMRQQGAGKRCPSYIQLYIWLIQLNDFFKNHNLTFL